MITLLLYAAGLILIMYYHEPWYDEAQAWLIARDATIKELLSIITHYEGHPPIWFLILMPFAKLGIPFEIGIKSVNFTLVTVAMGIFIFKSPFNRFIRCSIPFTYFFFYQYGVISRTYSLMMLGFVLSALLFKDRNEKPFRFIAALSLLCGASAYGILIAAGVSLVWLWEIIGKPFSLNKIKLLFRSKSFYALLLLLIYNILLLLCIYPYHDAYAIKIIKSSKIAKLFYMFFVAPADATCSFGYLGNKFQFVTCIIISIFINVIILKVTGMFGKQALFIVPYFLFGCFGGIVYFWIHHVGIVTMFYVFLLWCCFDKDGKNIETRKIIPSKLLYYSGYLLVYISIGISIYWSVCASIKDISINYGTGRETAKFIINNKLEQKNMLVAWSEVVDSNSGNKYENYNSVQGIPALAYFNKNIFSNFNNKLNNMCYSLHKVNTDGYYIKKLIRNNYPDVLIGTSEPSYTFGPKVNINDFALAKCVNGDKIWKTEKTNYKQYIYIRKDLLKNYPNIKILNIKKEKIQRK